MPNLALHACQTSPGASIAQATANGSVPAADSGSFAAALSRADVPRIVLIANITLQPADFDWRHKITIRRKVEVTACSGGSGSVVLDLGNNMVSRVQVADGGLLTFTGPALRIASAPPVMRHPLWPDFNPFLIGLLDISGEGAVHLKDVSLDTRSPANFTMRLERYPLALRPAYSVGPSGASVSISSWNLTHQAYADSSDGAEDARAPAATSGKQRRLLASPGALPPAVLSERGQAVHPQQQQVRGGRRLQQAAASYIFPDRFAASQPPQVAPGAHWCFERVTLDMPNTLECFADADVRGFPCDSGAVLKQQLMDVAVTHIALTGNIVFDPQTWPPSEANQLKQGLGLNVTHNVSWGGRGG